MLAGRAIVGTTVDAIGEILENRIDALLVNPASSQELTLAFRELIHQPSLRQQLGIAAQSKVKTQLTPSGEQQNWNWVYQQVLKQQEIPAMARVRLV
jgi:glycosyltransferase involved in cell wall biosynthesis